MQFVIIYFGQKLWAEKYTFYCFKYNKMLQSGLPILSIYYVFPICLLDDIWVDLFQFEQNLTQASEVFRRERGKKVTADFHQIISWCYWKLT